MILIQLSYFQYINIFFFNYSRLINQEEQILFPDVLVYTVATNETDGYKRYIRSAVVNGFRDKIETLGFGEPWRGGEDMHRSIGGGYKINLLKEKLHLHKDDKDKIILFTDG